MHWCNVKALFERTAIDNTGPFPNSNSRNSYALTAMDYFTKWPVVYAIPNQEASTVTDVLVTNFFCHFGVLRDVHSNQGQKFESPIMQEVLKHLEISKTRTIPLYT
jgi:hypothetical protein